MSAQQSENIKMKPVAALKEMMPERINGDDKRMARRFLKKVLQDSAAESEVFAGSRETTMEEVHAVKLEHEQLQHKRYLSGKAIPEDHDGYEQGQEHRYPVFTEENRKELSYLSNELDRLEKRMRTGIASATIIMNRFDPLDGHLANLRDNLKNNSQLTQPARVRLLISMIQCDHLGSIEDAIQSVDDLIQDTGMAATPNEVRTLVTRLTALFEERRDYQKPGEPPMLLSDFRRFLRKCLVGTDSAGQFHRLVEKALAAVDDFTQRPVDPDGKPGETDGEAIYRMLGAVQNIVGTERPITKQEAPGGAEGHTATRGPPTAHSAVATQDGIGMQEHYHQGYMAGLAAAALEGAPHDTPASIQRARRERAGTTGYRWTGGHTETTQLCRQYQRDGDCSWGDRCKYRHEGHETDVWQRDNSASRGTPAADPRQRLDGRRSRSRGSDEPREQYGTQTGYYGHKRRTRSRSTSADSSGAPPPQSARRSGGDTPGGDRRGGGGRSDASRRTK